MGLAESWAGGGEKHMDVGVIPCPIHLHKFTNYAGIWVNLITCKFFLDKGLMK
jgi:hypothetical protein